ncbi:hypothetical protein [Streptomyces chumphonensis]|uniref:hypothetical protein n=1 Tax=Streptomyces chumphonensis TaxID=1214925 RepID=UPI003D75AF04
MQHTAPSTATALRTLLDTWTRLRALLTTTSGSTWPPTMGTTEYLRALDEHDATDTAASREPRLLGESPAPLNLHVLDTCRSIDAALSALADEIALEAQRPRVVEPRPNALDPLTLDLTRLAAADRRDPQRWHYAHDRRTTDRAAAWLLARVEGTPGPSRPLHDAQLRRIARVVAGAQARMAAHVGGEERHDAMDRPCPWCRGVLTMHQHEHGTTVTCEHGHDCSAPVPVVAGRRTWSTPRELGGLEQALRAAERRRARADARRRQRAAKSGRAA